jgi:hypothetical protein
VEPYAGPLLAGRYNIFAIVTPPAASPTPLTPLANDGLVHIDMVPPNASKAHVRRLKALAHHNRVKSLNAHLPHQARPKHRRL